MNVDFLRDVALAVAQEQHLETVMKMIVEGINEEPDVALVRLWILESEDHSTECHLRPEAPNQTRWRPTEIRSRAGSETSVVVRLPIIS